MQPKLERLPTVSGIDAAQEPAYRRLVDGKAGAPGGLGRVGDLAVRLALIRQTKMPRIERVALLLFAADEAPADSGPARGTVTAAMVRAVLAGRAGANAFARAAGAEIMVVYSALSGHLPAHPNLMVETVRHGTRDILREAALGADEALAALTRGARVANQAIGAGADLVIPADLAVGDGLPARLLAHRLAPAALERCAGGEAGEDEDKAAARREALQGAAARSSATEPFDVLCEFGGLEIAMMAGAVIGAASRRRPVLIDGPAAAAAALVAIRLRPAARDYCIFGHGPVDESHALLLAALVAEPLLDVGLRLGQGTGALLAVPVLRAASLAMTDMAASSEVLSGRF